MQQTLSWQSRFAVVGSAIVFLLALAGLANAWIGRQPMPEPLKEAAVAVHLATVLAALPLGIMQVIFPKGTRLHRVIGHIWIGLMMVTALASFAIHSINPNGLSPIHIFSVMTLIAVPLIWYFARTHQVERHRDSALGLIVGGIVIAGLFTFLPQRALGQLLLRLLGFR